jgi:gamma-glutamyltranspeptidase/glutathione hydrolase
MAGDTADAIVRAVRTHANAGSLATSDLAGYRPEVREPLCFNYTTVRICGMPPPSSGTLAIGQILGILEATGVAPAALQNGLPDASWLHRYTEASRLAFADRGLFVADPAFVAAPGGSWNSMLAPAYLASRAAGIGTAVDAPRMPAAEPGKPGGTGVSWALMPDQTEYGTSHISIVDRFGNALAMTTTIEDAWGARLMVNRGQGLAGGFLLNNQLTDFSFEPANAQGVPVANRVEPGKRPRSSMSPLLVFDRQSGRLLISAGSPGGAMIIHFTAKTLYGMLHWGLNAQQAINLPNFGTLGGPVFVEQGGFPDATLQSLRARGHTVNEVPMPSGLQAIQRTSDGFFGGADPRREGLVLGD